MTTTVETQVTTRRASTWRDELLAEYEMSQARLRYLLEETRVPEEHL